MARPDAVSIIGIRNHKVILTKEFRIPINDFEWSFPAGLVESGENPEAAAVREFYEETGCRATKIYRGMTVSRLVSSAGLSDESTAIVVLEFDNDPVEHGGDETEYIRPVLADAAMIRKILESGDCISAKSIGYMSCWAALHWVFLPRFSEDDQIASVSWTGEEFQIG